MCSTQCAITTKPNTSRAILWYLVLSSPPGPSKCRSPVPVGAVAAITTPYSRRIPSIMAEGGLDKRALRRGLVRQGEHRQERPQSVRTAVDPPDQTGGQRVLDGHRASQQLLEGGARLDHRR